MNTLYNYVLHKLEPVKFNTIEENYLLTNFSKAYHIFSCWEK